MFKNIYFRLGFISSIFTLALLVALPKIPIVIQRWNIDSSIGGYYISLFNGKIEKDLRNYKLGLDLQGGTRVVLKANMDSIDQNQRDDVLDSARSVIERRVNLFGVSEPFIATSKTGNEYRIIVEIPGLDNIDNAISLIGQTAQLKFKVLKPDVEWTPDKDLEYAFTPDVWEETNLTGADLKDTEVVISQDTVGQNAGQPQIRLGFTNEGRQKFEEIAKANINKPVALFLDEYGPPVSMPIVNPDLASGLTNDPVISGNFDIESAKNLSIQIKAGVLPVPIEIIEQKTIGATLGNESVHKSLFAGVIGLALVLLFLLSMYGKLGFLADIALILYTILVLAIFKFVPVVLTLPGIAGFILSIGMASDANILIFERIKEEIYWGKPKNLAIKLGFERAWNSIKDSNISSLITAGVLFNFGTGPIRGFALTLAIGIAVSLFTSIFVVRTLILVFGIGQKEQSK